ncbi:hypothetical protein LSTR_LSTR006006 [Laodelphax striatellus]|uniref:Uncharacterized protein n=1 Tax=Laodelphax striatellus TaxID=195883 RepID=A0A482XPE7_LAOST|nr:hypothetical protein LSTR_LSTR006006 [Laodelphax striatellus]
MALHKLKFERHQRAPPQRQVCKFSAAEEFSEETAGEFFLSVVCVLLKCGLGPNNIRNLDKSLLRVCSLALSRLVRISISL